MLKIKQKRNPAPGKVYTGFLSLNVQTFISMDRASFTAHDKYVRNIHMKKIRPYKEEDHSSVVRIYAASKMDELINEKRNFEFLPLMQDKERSKKLFESNIFVYEKYEIVGYCAFFENEIRAIYVEPGSRGHGIGQQMLEFLLGLIQGKSFLFVAESNFQAKKLYQKYDFKIVDEFETQYNGLEVMANKMERNGDDRSPAGRVESSR